MRQFLHGSSSQRKSAHLNSVKTDGAVVCLIATPRREPMTPIEQRLIAMLKNAGPMPFAMLVKTAAKDLYLKNCAKGPESWISDCSVKAYSIGTSFESFCRGMASCGK
jgi:hypothetical protein